MANTVKVIETQTQTVLFECPMEEADKAFRYAVEMEGHGVDVTLRSPSGPESLAESLGISEEEKIKLRKVLEEEIEDHDDSCMGGGCSIQ
jgi:hypothetical protein